MAQEGGESSRELLQLSPSPDLSPITNCWVVSEQHVRKVPDDATKQLIAEGWAQLS
jgi:hypothetical protein